MIVYLYDYYKFDLQSKFKIKQKKLKFEIENLLIIIYY